MKKLVIGMIIISFLFIVGCTSEKTKAYIEVGKKAYQDQRYDDAVHAFSLALEVDPNHEQATQWLTDAKAQQTKEEMKGKNPGGTEDTKKNDEIQQVTRTNDGYIVDKELFILNKNNHFNFNNLQLGMPVDHFIQLLGETYSQNEYMDQNEGSYSWNLTSEREEGAQIHVYYQLDTKEVIHISFHTNQSPWMDNLGQVYFHDLVYEDDYYFNDQKEVVVVMRNSYSNEVGVVLEYADEQFYETVNTDYTEISVGLQINGFLPIFNQRLQNVYEEMKQRVETNGQVFQASKVQLLHDHIKKSGGFFEYELSSQSNFIMRVHPDGTLRYLALNNKINQNGFKDMLEGTEDEMKVMMEESTKNMMEQMVVQQSLIKITNPELEPNKVFDSFVKKYELEEELGVYSSNGITYYDFSDDEYTWFVVSDQNDNLNELYQELRMFQFGK